MCVSDVFHVRIWSQLRPKIAAEKTVSQRVAIQILEYNIVRKRQWEIKWVPWTQKGLMCKMKPRESVKKKKLECRSQW